MGLIGAASTAAANALAHSLTFALNLAIFTNLCQYLYHNLKPKRSPYRSHLVNFAPLYLMVLATVLVLVDLVRHVLMDAKSTYLTTLSGEHVPFSPDTCVYRVGRVSGAECPQRGLGPLFVREVSAVDTSGWSMYAADGSLSTIGWIVTVGCTWSGMMAMAVAITWTMKRKRELSESGLLREALISH